MHTTTLTVSEHRGKPRIWLEGKWLVAHGFTPGGNVRVQFGPAKVTITPGEGHKITPRGADRAIIDLNCAQIATAFGKVDSVQVVATDGMLVITPTRTAAKVAARMPNPTAVSLFAGGGLLSTAASQAGFKTLEAVEIDPKYAEIFQSNHPNAHMHISCISNVDFRDIANRVGPVGLLEMGIPCEPYSTARRSGAGARRNKELPPEAHALGDMVFWALKAVDDLNPYLVVAEEVPAFLTSGAGFVFQHALRRMGYLVEARVLDAADYGSLTSRQRAVIVGTTDDHINWPAPASRSRTLAEVLTPANDPSLEWFTRATKGWLFDHWDAQTAKGNGFAAPIVEYDAPSIGVIKKRYLSIQGDNPVIGHPADRGLPRDVRRVRLLTAAEIGRLQGLPDGYDLGSTKTTAGEVLGQGVQVDLFRQVLEVN